jgi:TPP-dependent pyruvate/acetoin dehydrogenase alpha subunit
MSGDRPIFVSGGAPGLGKRSSRWFDSSKAYDEDRYHGEEEGQQQYDLDPVEMIERMLTDPTCLTQPEFDWVKKIDQTVARLDDSVEMTHRQAEVIAEIYSKYAERRVVA